MSRIKGKDTKPELYLRKLLYSRGFRYRVNYKNLPGKPDIYLSKHKTAVFINGCFWHMHENCRYSSIPKTNTEFWEEKLTKNVERDRKNCRELEAMNIRVITVWECKIKEMQKNKEVENEEIDKLINEITKG